MMLAASMALAGCLAVGSGSDRILAKDLAPAFPEIAAAPPEAPVALAPAPGVIRVFSVGELRALARRLGIPAAPSQEICVVRPVAPLSPARILEAMRRQLPQAEIEILELSRQPAPEGDIEFPLAALRYSAEDSLWTGNIRYGENRRFSIWARVKISSSVLRVVAVADLQAGQPIQAVQLMLQTRQGLPAPGILAQSIEEVTGKCPRVAIRAGSEIRSGLLEKPKDVRRGETVRVEVQSGAASLDFEAEAETSGVVGDTVIVRNPVSQKPFRARVEAKGKVRVETSVPLNP